MKFKNKEISLRDRLLGFASEYQAMCEKYNLEISACGCCNSPFLTEITRSIKNEGLNLSEMDDLCADNIVARVQYFVKEHNI